MYMIYIYIVWYTHTRMYLWYVIWWDIFPVCWSLSHQVLDAGEQLPGRPGTGWSVLRVMTWWWPGDGCNKVSPWFTMVQHGSTWFTMVQHGEPHGEYLIWYDQSSHWKAFRMLCLRFQWLGVACLSWKHDIASSPTKKHVESCWTLLNLYLMNVYRLNNPAIDTHSIAFTSFRPAAGQPLDRSLKDLQANKVLRCAELICSEPLPKRS